MPISKYFGGHGASVMRDMRSRYGDRAERVFHATANKRDQKPRENPVMKGLRSAVTRQKRGY